MSFFALKDNLGNKDGVVKDKQDEIERHTSDYDSGHAAELEYLDR